LVIVFVYEEGRGLYVGVLDDRGADRARGPGDGLEAARARVLASPVIFSDTMPQAFELLDQLVAIDCVPGRLLPCTSLEVVKSLAAAGVGLGLLPRRVALDDAPRSLRLLHPRLPSRRDAISLVYRADMHRTRGANLVKDTLVAYGARLEDTPD
jgi:DNA-binding transcriptional LysR family regulator